MNEKQVLAQFVVHLRGRGIKFVSNRGEVLCVRMAAEQDPIMKIIHEYIGEEEEND